MNYDIEMTGNASMDIIKKYQKIRPEFSSVFGKCTLTNNSINYDTINYKDAYHLAHNILSFYIKIKTKSVQLYDLITHSDVIDIIITTIEEYALSQNTENKEVVQLSALNDYKNFFELLDKNLHSAPLLLTTALIPIPFVPQDKNDIQISDNIIISSDLLYDYKKSDKPGGLPFRFLNSNSDETISILKISTSGFPSQDINSSTTQSIILQYKAFVMLCKLLELIEFSKNIFLEKKFMNFFITDSDLKKIKHKLPLSINESLFTVTVNTSFNQDLLNAENNIVSSFFNNSSEDKWIICTSLAWLFDSYMSDGIIKSIINLSISIESLLSEEGRNNVTEVLASKFAYSLGPLPSVRKHLKKEMESFYDIRSKIVHGRKIKSLKEAERQLIKTRYYFEKELKLVINHLVDKKLFISILD